MVTKVLGKNLIISQHTRNITEPMWGAKGKSWFGRSVVIPEGAGPYQWGV